MVDAHIPVVEALDLRADAAQHLGHDVDVGDARDVGQHAATLGEQAARHELECRILRTTCPDGAPERAAGLDHHLIHDPKYRRWTAWPDRQGTIGDQLWSGAVVTSRQAPDRNLAMDLVRVTEAAAMAASRWMGRGDKLGADGAAVEAMRTVLSSVPMDGIVVIGEGEKDNAPMLFNGEKIGDGTPPLTDIAVDPIDGTTLTAQGRGGALAVIAVAERGAMFDPGPCVYMEKLAVGPRAKGAWTSGAHRRRTSTPSPKPWAAPSGI